MSKFRRLTEPAASLMTERIKSLLLQGPVERREIIEQIGKVLPPYMVPNVFCRVEEMPLTKNGKIDRGKLMEIYREICKERITKRSNSDALRHAALRGDDIPLPQYAFYSF